MTTTLPTTSRRRVALSLSLLVVTAMLSGPAHASCAGPGLSVSPARATAGSTVSGRYLFDGCEDTGGGCSGQPDPSHPLRPLTLEIVTSAGSVELGEFNPDGSGARTKQIVIPADLRGPVSLRLLTKRGDQYAATQLLVLAPPPTSASPT